MVDNKLRVTDYDIATHLKDEEDIAGYLKAIAEENDPQLFISALNDVVRARSMNKIGNQNNSIKNLDKDLSNETSFNTIYKMIDDLGFRMAILPKN